MSFTSLNSRRRVQLLAAVVALIFVSVLYLYHPPVEGVIRVPFGQNLGGSPPDLACRRLPGADDILVVLKTGGTVSQNKLPIHFKTTFRCIPHWVVFSDLEEEIEGYRVHNVLDEIDDSIRATVEEFRLYDQIQEWHANGAMPLSIDEDLRRQAWNLDKWKFLPLVKKALDTRPEAKWYFFMEADTHLVWSNLLLYLAQLNPDEPHYLGAPAWSLDTEFAHGGSGFIISAQALHMVVDEYTNHTAQYNELTRSEWAGDVILAKAMKNQDIHLTRAFPIIQGETPYTLDYTERHWCFPVVSYHHMTPEWIQTMWNYEQEWMAAEQAKGSNETAPILHRHVFAHFVQPTISLGEKTIWDNLSPDQVAGDETSLNTCRSLCMATPLCIQWLFTAAGSCRIADVVRLGGPAEGADFTRYTSGWMTDKVAAFVDKMGHCQSDWILSNA